MEVLLTQSSTTPRTRAPADAAEGAAELALRYFECLPKPTLLLRPDGAIARTNGACRALLLEQHCLRVAYGRVVGFAGTASERFEAACERALATGAGRVVVTVFAGGAELWQVELVSLQLETPPRPGDTMLMVTVHAPVRAERGIVALARIFALTCAETRVLAHLADDRTPNEISATLGVSVTTVRTHLQALFQKTGARRQAELVRLALLAASS